MYVNFQINISNFLRISEKIHINNCIFLNKFPSIKNINNQHFITFDIVIFFLLKFYIILQGLLDCNVRLSLARNVPTKILLLAWLTACFTIELNKRFKFLLRIFIQFPTYLMGFWLATHTHTHIHAQHIYMIRDCLYVHNTMLQAYMELHFQRSVVGTWHN